MALASISNNSGIAPLHRVIPRELVAGPDAAAATLALRHAAARARQVHVEVHAVDAGRRVVLEPQVDVLADAEAERAVLAEVLLAELVLQDLPQLRSLWDGIRHENTQEAKKW